MLGIASDKPNPILLYGKEALNMVEQDCNDCACTFTSSPKVFLASAEPILLEDAKDSFQFSFGSQWQGMYLFSGKGPFAVLNHSAYDLWKSFQHPRSLLNLDARELVVAQQMANIGLLVSSESERQPSFSQQSVQLFSWLHITDRCNLRCAYCYLPHNKEDMTLETGKAAIDAVFREARANHYQQVKFKYAGGEPLLRFPFVVELHRYAQQLAKKFDLGLDAVVLSNGTLLTHEIIRQMQTMGLRLMISLDGMGDWHDAQRPYAGGRGTFNDVAEAVELALHYGLIPDISITVSGRSAEGLPEIIAWVLERNLPFSLNFYRQNDFSVLHEDLKLEEEKIIDGMLAAFAVIEKNLSSRSLLASLTDRANLSTPHVKTCSVGDSYLVFNQHGQVSKCQMQMAKPVADAHTENLLQVVRDDKSGIENISVEEKEGCCDCDWKYWCAGGCPLETYRATGRYDVKSPNCNIYKTIFPEVLRLEGLRLLKEAGELA